MKFYLLWFNEWEANNLLGIFETFEEAARLREFLLAYASTLKKDEDDEEEYTISTMGHFARNKDLDDRICIEEKTFGCSIKIDNLKLLEWEASKDEKTNP